MGKEKVRGAPFTLGSFMLRLAFTLVLVFITFNPSHYSFVHWLMSSRAAHTLGPEHERRLASSVTIIVG